MCEEIFLHFHLLEDGVPGVDLESALNLAVEELKVPIEVAPLRGILFFSALFTPKKYLNVKKKRYFLNFVFERNF